MTGIVSWCAVLQGGQKEYLHASWALASGPWIIALQGARVADIMLIAVLSTFSRHAKLSGRKQMISPA